MKKWYTFSPNNRYIAGIINGTIYLWDMRTDRTITLYSDRRLEPGDYVEFSLTNDLLCCISASATIKTAMAISRHPEPKAVRTASTSLTNPSPRSLTQSGWHLAPGRVLGGIAVGHIITLQYKTV